MKADRNIISSVPGPLDMSSPWAMSISQTLGGLSEQISPLIAGFCLKTNQGLGKTTTLDVFPDTGCQQTLLAEDLVSACGLVLDQTKKKKIKSGTNSTATLHLL